MRPFTGTKCHKHLGNWSFCTNTFNFLHVPTLDDFTWNLQSCFADLFHPVIFNSMTALFYSFPELPPSCFRASSAAPHTCSFTMAILAEPFHLSCLKSPAGIIHHFRSPLRATGLLPLSDFLPHTLPRSIPSKSCWGFPAYLSFSHVRYTSENFCPPAVGICAKLCSQQGETLTPVTAADRQRTGKVCEADKADTKNCFAEILLTADVFKVSVFCINQLVF